MPKVSQHYKDARREQILAAAKVCFARKGFHETSMQDLFAESGLSAGAVYRYFPGKADVVVAIAEANLDEILSLADGLAADHRGGVGAALSALLGVLRAKNTDTDLGAMQVLVWGEALRNPRLAERLRAAMNRMCASLAALVRDEQAAGTIPATVDADALARLLTALIPGSALQFALLEDESIGDVAAAAKSLWPH